MYVYIADKDKKAYLLYFSFSTLGGNEKKNVLLFSCVSFLISAREFCCCVRPKLADVVSNVFMVGRCVICGDFKEETTKSSGFISE